MSDFMSNIVEDDIFNKNILYLESKNLFISIENNLLQIKNLKTNIYFNFEEIITKIKNTYKIKYYQKLNNIYYFNNHLLLVSYFVKDKYNNKNYYYIGINLNNNEFIKINQTLFDKIFLDNIF
jgi:hypothetical protein